MKHLSKTWIMLLICELMILFLSPVVSSAKPSVNRKLNDDGKLLRRIEFGNEYIMGQTIKSGAVYLLQRKRSDIRSMLKPRENYRKEILENFEIKKSETTQ